MIIVKIKPDQEPITDKKIEGKTPAFQTDGKAGLVNSGFEKLLHQS